MTSLRTQVPPVNLKERIAALQQKNSEQSQRPTSPPPTTSSSTSSSGPPSNVAALREKIARFEKKGGVPVPRGSFGLGAPPTDSGQGKTSRELYGNRIPAPVKPQTTGGGSIRPQYTGGSLMQQFTGPANNSRSPSPFEGTPRSFSPPSPALEPLKPIHTGRRGTEFTKAMELARKTEADNQQVYDPRLRENSTSPVPSPPPPIIANRRFSMLMDDPPAIIVSPQPDLPVEAEDVSSSDPAMFDEKGAVLSEEEATTVDSTVSHERQSKESPPLEPSIPSPVPTSASTSYKPALEDSSLPDNPITPAAESEQDEFRQEISTQNDIQNDHSATVTPTIFDTEPGRDVDEHGLPMDSTGLTNVAVVESPIIAVSDDLPVDSLPSGSILETELKSLDPSSVISPRVTGIELSGEDPSNIQEPIRPVSAILTPPVEVEDIFLSPPTMSPARNEPDSTTNDTTEPKTLPPLSIPSTRSAVRDSLLSQRSIDDPSPRSSYTESPGHLTVAHKISPITSRGVSIFLPGARTPTSAEFKVISEDSVSSLHDAAEKLQTETTPKLTASHNTEPGMTNTSRPAKKPTPMDLDGDAESDHEPLPERPKTAVPSAWSDTMSPPGVEFGTVIVGDLSKRPVPIVAHPRSFSSTYPDADFNPKPQGKNTSQTLNAVVYEKSRDKPAFQSATLPRSTPQRRGGRPPTLEDPMSPGFGDLLSLVAQSAILEQKLMNGEYPDEALPVKEMHEGPTSAPVRPSMGMEERQAKEAEDQEKYKELLRRRPSTKSMKGRGSSDSRRKPSFSLRNPLGRSKSANRKEDEAELGLGSAPAQANREHAVPNRSKSMFLTSSSQPSFSNVLPVPVIPSVVNDNSTSNNNNFTDEIPPTPPPKSPSARYLSSFRKFTSTRSQGAYQRHSVSMSSEISSEDSVAVLTPPDNSPGFAGTGPLLQTRSRTQSANRPGSVINVPWPSMSPKKSQGSVSRATSFAGKMFRGRKKSNASTMSAFDADPSQQTIPELPSVLPPSPSLHELLMPETSLNSLHPPPSTPPQNGGRPQISTRTSWISTTSNDSSVRSPLLDQEFFDSFPSVPQTIPTPNTRSVIAGHGHSKEHSQGGVSFPRKSSDGYPSSYHGTKSSVHGRAASIKSTSTLGPHNAQMDLL